MSTIFFIAGNSGGHILPLISYSKKIKNLCSNFYFVSTALELDKKIIKNEEKNFNKIFEMKLSKIPTMPKDFLFLILDIFKTFYLLIKYKPQCIYTTGGYLSVIFTFIAFILRIPVYIFHLDFIPGKAGKLISFWVKENWIVFDKTEDFLKNNYFKKIIKKIDYPIKFINEKILTKEDICKNLNLDKNKFFILILGGSQGSIEINNLMYKFFEDYQKKENIFIIHQTGLKDKNKFKEFYKKLKIENIVFDFKENISDYYICSDLIISRGGAGTLFEIIYFNKNAIIIPLKNVAQNHQILNSLELQKKYKKLEIILDDEENIILNKFKLLI